MTRGRGRDSADAPEDRASAPGPACQGKRVIAEGQYLGQGSKVRQAVPTAQLVERPREMTEDERQGPLEIALGQRDAQQLHDRVLRQREIFARREWAPVGVDERRVRNPVEGRRDRQRQTEIADDEIGAHRLKEPPLLAHVGGERAPPVKSLAARNAGVDDGRRQRPDRVPDETRSRKIRSSKRADAKWIS